MRAYKCPNCGATINIDTKAETFYCQYCGSKLSIYDKSVLRTERIVDEAKIREIEFREKKYFHEEEKRAKSKKRRLLAALICGLIGAICLTIVILGDFPKKLFLLLPAAGGLIAGLALLITALQNQPLPNSEKVERKRAEKQSNAKACAIIGLIFCILGIGPSLLPTIFFIIFGLVPGIIASILGSYAMKNGTPGIVTLGTIDLVVGVGMIVLAFL